MARIDAAAPYNGAVPADPPTSSSTEIEAIVLRLRDELEAGGEAAADDGDELFGSLPSRRRADRLWAVSAERPYLARPGTWGRVRGALLLPLKALLRRAMRWYVEPFATDQRQFNAALLRLLDEQHEATARALERIDERLRTLEQRSE